MKGKASNHATGTYTLAWELHVDTQGRRQGGGQGPGPAYGSQIYIENLNFD